MGLSSAIIATLGLLLAAPPAESEAIREAFDAYKGALLSKDGKAALDLVDRGTIAYYEEMRRLALEADAATVKKRPFLDRFIVVRMRHQVGVEKLRKLDAPGVFRLGIDSGWIGDVAVQKQSLGSIKVEGETAIAPVLLEGQAVPLEYRFLKEKGEWRVNLIALNGIINKLLERLAKDRDMVEDEFILDLVGALSGKDVPTDIWDKPGQ